MNEELQSKLDALESEKANLNPNNPDDRFRATIIDQEIAGIREQLAAEDRLQQQAAEVAEIELPLDYDIVWGVDGANEEIRSLIRQTKEQLFAKHNDELAQQREKHTSSMKTVEADNADLINRVADLEIRAEQAEVRADKAEGEIRYANQQTAEAIIKRDASVIAKEEAEAERDRYIGQVKSLNSQVNELESMLRTYRSQASGGYAGGLKLTSNIKAESDEERAARQERERIEAANRALARWGSEPLQLPSNPAHQEVATTAEEPKEEPFHPDAEEQHADRLDAADDAVEVAGEAPSLEERLAALEARMDRVSYELDQMGIAV